MAARSDNVTWTHLTFLSGILVVVIGGGFAWIHGDIADIRTNVGAIASEAAATNGKLDILIEEMKK